MSSLVIIAASIFTARRYASAVYMLSSCVRLSHAAFVPKWLNAGSRKYAVRLPRDSSCLMPKMSAKFERGHFSGAPNGGGVS